MRKLLLIFVVVLFSCEKDVIVPEDPKFCWECWKDTKGAGFYYSHQVVLCGLSEKEIGVTMSANTYTQNNVQYSMRCQKYEYPR